VSISSTCPADMSIYEHFIDRFSRRVDFFDLSGRYVDI